MGIPTGLEECSVDERNPRWPRGIVTGLEDFVLPSAPILLSVPIIGLAQKKTSSILVYLVQESFVVVFAVCKCSRFFFSGGGKQTLSNTSIDHE